MTVDVDVLEIFGVGVPPYSVRGAVQSLEPIEQAAKMRRNLNGNLRDLSATQFRKYRTTITCQDQQPPAFGEVWPGLEVVIWCISELALEGSTGSSGIPRPFVSGSLREESGFTFYRPVLTCLITDFSVERDKYNAVHSWTLEAEEV